LSGEEAIVASTPPPVSFFQEHTQAARVFILRRLFQPMCAIVSYLGLEIYFIDPLSWVDVTDARTLLGGPIRIAFRGCWFFSGFSCGD
jgi:hypothetical protein